MATRKQKSVARKNVRKAQATWRSMSKQSHSRAEPEGRARKRPGAGGGKFFRIEVRPKSEFVTFRTQDVGTKGHLERLSGKRSSGSWDTATWLVSKEDAHVKGKSLVIDNPDIQAALIEKKQIRGAITHVKGDVFRAKPRKDVAEKEKPTAAQKQARKRNIQKAQASRHK